MEVELVQTFIPIVHKGIGEGIGTNLGDWLKTYGWVFVLILVAICIWYFSREKEQPKKAQPIKAKPSSTVGANLFYQSYPPTFT